jgi:hypothetical protein
MTLTSQKKPSARRDRTMGKTSFASEAMRQNVKSKLRSFDRPRGLR